MKTSFMLESYQDITQSIQIASIDFLKTALHIDWCVIKTILKRSGWKDIESFKMMIWHKFFQESWVEAGVNDFVDITLSSSDDSLDDIIPLALDDHESWHGWNFVGLRKFRGLVDVDLDQWNSFSFGCLNNIGSNCFAWSAPTKL